MIRPNNINPVEAAAEKYNFFLTSFFWSDFTLLSNTFISVLFDLNFSLSWFKYLERILFFMFELRIFTTLFNHGSTRFANLPIKKGKFPIYLMLKLKLKE